MKSKSLLVQEKLVLFGAGVTGLGVVDYFGKEKFIAVIDNSKNKQGGSFEGIPIISFDEYLRKYAEYQVVISIYSKWYYSCKRQLVDAGVFNYFTAPPLLYGVYDKEDIYEKICESGKETIFFYGYNPISLELANMILDSEKGNIGWIKRVDWHTDGVEIEKIKHDTNALVVITTNPAEDNIRDYLIGENIIDIYSYCYKKRNEIEQLHNSHEGEVCFIVGNGPSLRIDDLVYLRENHVITFASNAIFKSFDNTEWRPDYYMIIDGMFYKDNIQTIIEKVDCTKILPILTYDGIFRDDSALYYNVKNVISDSSEFEFSSDAASYICSGKTVTYALFQLACYMGFKKIYLLGVDWTGGKGTGKSRGHFYEDNSEINKVSFDLIAEERIAYESAKKYADSNNIHIYNATRGGELEVFERVDFEKLKKNIKCEV